MVLIHKTHQNPVNLGGLAITRHYAAAPNPPNPPNPWNLFSTDFGNRQAMQGAFWDHLRRHAYADTQVTQNMRFLRGVFNRKQNPDIIIGRKGSPNGMLAIVAVRPANWQQSRSHIFFIFPDENSEVDAQIAATFKSD